MKPTTVLVLLFKGSCFKRFASTGYLHAHRGGDRGHAEEDAGAGLRHAPGPGRCQDAADGPAGICGNDCQPGKVEEEE